jgi:hypothetical protein
MKQRQVQKPRLTVLTKGILVAGGGSILAAIAYFTLVIQTSGVDNAQAERHARSMMGYDQAEGEIICAFSWDGHNVLQADRGSSAATAGASAVVLTDLDRESNGLSAGKGKQDINLQIPASSEFNTEGIDISFDFRRTEESCDFYSRGSYFNFGMKKGRIAVTYKVSLPGGGTAKVDEATRYEIPADGEFRNIRFVYNPPTGKGEVLVNGVTVWSHDGPEQAPLHWRAADPVLIARGMNGNGTDQVILDNFVIRSTRNTASFPVHLLNFEAKSEEGKNEVMVRWFTAKEMDTDSFRIERSENGLDFVEIGVVKAAGQSNRLRAYALYDIHPIVGKPAYYRLVPTNKAITSITVPVIGYKYRKNHIENMPVEQAEAAVKEQLEGAKAEAGH